MDTINSILGIATGLSDKYIWGYAVIYALILVGLFFTFKTNFFQVRMLKHAFSLLRRKQDNLGHNISAFQALSTSLASLIGVGSLAGMTIAISLGGPGAIFWVWVIAFLGMIINVSEHILGQVYKKVNAEGRFIGGPAYYILHGLKNKYLAFGFSFTIILAYGFAFNSIQANTIGFSLENAFNIDRNITAIILTILTALVIAGGIKRIAKSAGILVPLMGAVYIFLALAVVLLNIEKIPSIFALIITNAFGYKEAAAGSAAAGITYVLMIGIKRALFSTEAGLGSTPNISASAASNHPVEQGLLGMVAVFTVAFIVCTATALIILSADVYKSTQGIQGIDMLQESLKVSLGNISVYLLSFCVFVFGFTSIMGNYSYAENNMNIFTKNKLYTLILRSLVIVIVFIGTIAELSFVWSLADFVMGFMVLINVYALIRLSKVILKVIKDYQDQLKAGKTPIFTKKVVEDLKEIQSDKENVW